MTEAEAKTKACPVATLRGADGNRDKGHCIASDCMAWRWDDKSLIRRDVVISTKDGSIADAGFSVDGYCGLAGGAA